MLLAAAGALRALEPAKGQRAVSGVEQPALAPFDEPLSRFVKEQQVPGAQLAVAKDGRLVYARGSGWINSWHTGSFDGTSALLVRRRDGGNWAVLLNARTAPDGRRLSDKTDPLLHAAADRVRSSPGKDQFPDSL